MNPPEIKCPKCNQDIPPEFINKAKGKLMSYAGRKRLGEKKYKDQQRKNSKGKKQP